MRNVERIIQEYVPGRQVSLLHVIANPDEDLYNKLGITKFKGQAIGIFKSTPGEVVIIAGNSVLKAADVEIGFIDRFSGSMIICGSVSSVKESFRLVENYLIQHFGFESPGLTTS